MPVYAAREIYRFARLAGFSPDQATTMTAIALAESGGNSGAHNPHGEDSRGLWQINARAHPNLAGQDLYDPVANARAAYQVSGGGKDVSAWTTTHGGGGAPYLAYRAEAQAAAAASGDPVGGVWTGTEGYGHPLAAGGGGGHPLATVAGADPYAAAYATGGAGGTDPTAAAGHSAVQTFLDSALAQQGDQYVWGVEDSVSNPDPKAFDCSELVQWAAGRAGVTLPDGSWNQYLSLQQEHATISVEQALHTPGALLFSFSSTPTAGGGRPAEAHVAISLGDGRTIEAASPETGVGIHQAGHRFNYAAVVPGLGSGAAVPGVMPDATAGTALALTGGPAVDSDHDGLTDALETQLGLNPHSADTDGDHISDGYELLQLHTNALKADSDGDGLYDSLELALKTNPLNPDSDHDGIVDGGGQLAGGTRDSDHDGLSDALERILGSNPLSADSDGDGFTDGAEYRAGFDPAKATSNPLAAMAGGGTGVPGAGVPGAAGPLPGTDPVAAATGGDPLTGQTALPNSLTSTAPPLPEHDPTWGLGHPLDTDLGH